MAPWCFAAEMPEMLRADLQRQFQQLLALGWLGRAYQFLPQLVTAVLPKVFDFEAYDATKAVRQEDGTVEITLKESSILARGLPFHFRLETSDDSRVTSASLLRIGCDLNALAAGDAVETGLTEGQVCEWIKDEENKKVLVSALVTAIFDRLSPVAAALDADVSLRSTGPRTFSPKKEVFGREGSSEKWLQCICGYYFAAAQLEDVYLEEDPSARFTFYLDPLEPLNSEDPTKNVNPEVVCCQFLEKKMGEELGRCELSPFFCPAPLATNAHLVQLDTQFRRGDVVNLECHTGFTYLEGDLQIYCNVSDDHDGGQWKVADGTVAKPVVCVPQQDFCLLPLVSNGYVYNVTEQGTMGSVIELHCQDGFQDPRSQVEQRTALCGGLGQFQVGISRVSRDLIRATNLVQDVLDELESYWAMDTRESDTNWRALMQFEYRWRSELERGLEGLPDGSAVQEVLFQIPNYDGVTDKWLAVFTMEDVRNLKRMLEEKQLEMLDLVEQHHGMHSAISVDLFAEARGIGPPFYCVFIGSADEEQQTSGSLGTFKLESVARSPLMQERPSLGTKCLRISKSLSHAGKPLPPNSQFTTTSPTPVALGEEISMECHPHYVYDLGLQTLMCGNSINGSSQWLAPDGSQARPEISCTLNRSWCPELPSLINHAAVVSMMPLHRAVDTEVRFACRRGFQATAGHAFGRCSVDGWCSMADPSDPTCVTPPDWLRCEAIPAYCPPWSGYNFSEPYNSSSAPKVVRVVDPLAHVFLREVRQLPLPSGLLGDVVTVTCPSEFSRASGDTRFRCGHGLNGGQWQREVASVPQYNDNSTPDAILHLVDEATAEPLVCELETMKGVRRKYYDRLPGLFRNHSDSAGYDVVPYINQFQSPYDAAQFEAYLRPKLAGNYTLSIEVLGSFVLTWEKEILLAGRSQGLFPELFNTSELELSSDQFYFFHLEYWADPLLPERTDQEMITFPRRIRFLWSGPAGEMQPVPYTELYHSFDEVYGYPITLRGINDPAPCDSQNTVSITGLLEGDNGTIIDGSIGYNYNEDLTCDWMLEATGNVRFTIFANFFDVVGTTNCGGDRLEFYVAAGNA
ncbi:unnamed protein product, partial [Cladocopium goreaui]